MSCRHLGRGSAPAADRHARPTTAHREVTRFVGFGARSEGKPSEVLAENSVLGGQLRFFIDWFDPLTSCVFCVFWVSFLVVSRLIALLEPPAHAGQNVRAH